MLKYKFLAMVLAILGVYGVMAFGVGQRMPEVSVRLAIGATSRDIVWLMVKDGLRPVLIGLVVGLGSVVATARLFARELSAISPYDPIAFGVAVGLLAGSALVAVLIPAWRSARTDPTALLRHT